MEDDTACCLLASLHCKSIAAVSFDISFDRFAARILQLR